MSFLFSALIKMSSVESTLIFDYDDVGIIT